MRLARRAFLALVVAVPLVAPKPAAAAPLRTSGTLAELLGAAALPGDVQLRTFGLRRAAARTLAVLQPSTVAVLEAYAEGVNAWAETDLLVP
jgi:acyl-homoserine lactone acylase PvdQ